MALIALLVVVYGTPSAAQEKGATPPANGGKGAAPEPGKGARLTAPRVTVEQTADGCVRLSWEAVPGARSYVLGRSEDRGGYQRVPDAPTGPATVYLDPKVRSGMRLSYTVTPIDADGLAGFRAMTDNFYAETSARGSCSGAVDVHDLRVSTVVAERSSTGFVVTWSPPSGPARGFMVRHLIDGRPVESPWVSSRISPPKAQLENAAVGEHQFEVLAEDDRGNYGPAVSSNLLVVGGGASASSGSSGGSSMAGAELSFAMSAALSLRTGTSRPVGGPAGAQWSSLDRGAATVTADGTITGRSAGEARVVGVNGTAAGGVRVTVVHVVVTP